MLYVPEAQGSLLLGPTQCTHAVRVPASGVLYVPCTVALQASATIGQSSTGAAVGLAASGVSLGVLGVGVSAALSACFQAQRAVRETAGLAASIVAVCAGLALATNPNPNPTPTPTPNP